MQTLLQIQMCLLFLTSGLGKSEQVTAVDEDQPKCEQSQYFSETLGKCCSKCLPGNYMNKECTQTSDTECQPCKKNTFMTSLNYATTCNRCKKCAPFLILKEECNATTKQVCVCPEGYTCSQKDGVGECMRCKFTASTTEPPPPTISGTTPFTYIEPLPDPRVKQLTSGYPLWAILTTVIFVIIAIPIALLILYLHRNPAILNKIFCIDKTKKPQLETGSLKFPLQESNVDQSGEIALNSMQRHPIKVY